MPQFVFELADDTVRLRLLARSERNQSRLALDRPGMAIGSTRRTKDATSPKSSKTRVSMPPCTGCGGLTGLRPKPGFWVGDANENFLDTLAHAWPDKPEGRGIPRQPGLSPPVPRAAPIEAASLIVKGSGIDWFSVSAEWEQEGLNLTPGRPGTAADGHGPFREIARCRLGRTGHRRGAAALTKPWPTWAWMA